MGNLGTCPWMILTNNPILFANEMRLARGGGSTEPRLILRSSGMSRWFPAHRHLQKASVFALFLEALVKDEVPLVPNSRHEGSTSPFVIRVSASTCKRAGEIATQLVSQAFGAALQYLTTSAASANVCPLPNGWRPDSQTFVFGTKREPGQYPSAAGKPRV
jgi:hypothetical protein